ncbi:MAG: hypothetical protein WD775_15470 [Burkholderiales bacterium]
MERLYVGHEGSAIPVKSVRGAARRLPSARGTLARRNLRLGLILGGVWAFMFTAAIVAGVLAHMANG